MIGTPSEADISFFEAFAQVVQASGLSHAEIARRANKRLKEAHERMLALIQDPAEKILTGIAESKGLYVHRATINRAVRAIDIVTPETLERIALGLDLDDETFQWLKRLLKTQPYVHHSTQQRVVVNSGTTVDDLPSWFNNY